MKKILALILGILMLASAVACGDITELGDAIEDKLEAKDFTTQNMTITLHEGFVGAELEGYTAAWAYNKTAIFTLREDFSAIEGYTNISVKEYAELLLKVNSGKNPGALKQEDGLTYFEYEFLNEDEDVSYSYLTAAYSEGDGIYWMVQFSTITEDYADRRDDFIKWAKTVKFA